MAFRADTPGTGFWRNSKDSTCAAACALFNTAGAGYGSTS